MLPITIINYGAIHVGAWGPGVIVIPADPALGTNANLGRAWIFGELLQ